MAIQFAREQFISRRTGGNTVRNAAYQMRGQLRDERTGELTPNYLNKGSLDHHEILLPAGISARWADAATLWNAVEKVERRKDAFLARVFVVALPTDKGVTLDDWVAMLRAFVHEHFVSKGLPAQIDIHGGRNGHGHIALPTRRLTPEGFEPRKALDLLPQVRSSSGRRYIAEGELWGQTWADFQNQWFTTRNREIRVKRVAEFPGVHIGPKRFRHPRDPRIEQNRKLELLNALRRDRHPETGRRATVEDIARELSKPYLANGKQRPSYRQAEENLRKAVADLHKIDGVRDSLQRRLAKAEADIAHRWSTLGAARKILHKTGPSGLRDAEMEEFANRKARAEWAINRAGFRKKNRYLPALAVAKKQLHEAFEQIRPEAEQELQYRQGIVRDARNALDIGRALRQDRDLSRSRAGLDLSHDGLD